MTGKTRMTLNLVMKPLTNRRFSWSVILTPHRTQASH